MEELRYQLYEETMKECTFNPQITNVATKVQRNVPSPNSQGFHQASASDPVYLRLYRQKDQLPRSITEKKHRTHEERELDGCTFAPTIYSQLEKPIGKERIDSRLDEKESEKLNSTNLEMNSTIVNTNSRDDGDLHSVPVTPNGFSETVQRLVLLVIYITDSQNAKCLGAKETKRKRRF